MPPAFTLATWNILATSYIRPDFYPNTPPAVLDPHHRIPALCRRAGELAVDILCLQEVERDTFAALRDTMLPNGYAGKLAMKSGKKPDGCAVFFRNDRCRLVTEHRLVYQDGAGAANSGHIAQVMVLDILGVRLDLVNTHLKWDAARTPRDRQWGYRQASQALAALPERTPSGIQIICGDFNVTSGSPIIRLLTSAGFDSTHHAGANIYSCNSSREPKLIDYIFFRGPVHVEPVPLPVIDSETPLPSPDQPSDHLPLIAHFT